MKTDFRVLFEHTPTDSVVFDPQLRVVAATSGWSRRTRLVGVEVEGQRIRDLLPDGSSVDADGPALLEEAARRAFHTREREKLLVRCAVETEEGGLDVRQWEVATCTIAGGALVMQTLVDVTEGRRDADVREHLLALEQTQASAARALTGAETERRRLRAVIGALPVGVVVIDAGGQIVESNGVASALLTDSTVLSALHRAAAGSNVDESFEAEHDGAPALYLVSAAPVTGAGGRVIGAVAVFVDITERTQEARAREAERERLDVTLRSIGDAVLATDTEGRVVMMNPVAEDLTGWSEADAIGRPVEAVVAVDRDGPGTLLRDLVAEAIRRRARVGPARHARIVAQDGVVRTVTESAAPMLHDGVCTGVVLVLRDVSNLKRLEDELLTVNKLQAIGVLAGGIAHDFNNILTIVIGNLDVVEPKIGDSPAVKARLEDARRACARARDLTGQLLTFSRGGSPIKGALDVERELRDAFGLWATGSNVSVDLRIGPDLWPVAGDPTQLAQVMHNLFVNASHAMPHGGVLVVGAANETVGPDGPLPLRPGRYVRVDVRDQGVGIAPADLPHIFEPFFSRTAGGTGLGLATAFSIIRQHDGHISVQSEPGRGTVFSIRLPASSVPPSPQSRAPAAQGAHAAPRSGRGRVLVMDDERDLAEVVEMGLTEYGFDVEVAYDGAAAVAAFEAAIEAGTPFHAVVLDLTVPGGMGGREAVRKLRAIDPSVRAIASTGYSQESIAQDLQSGTFAAFQPKPYRIEELVAKLSQVLRADA